MEKCGSLSYLNHFVRAKDNDDGAEKTSRQIQKGNYHDDGVRIRKFYEEITNDYDENKTDNDGISVERNQTSRSKSRRRNKCTSDSAKHQTNCDRAEQTHHRSREHLKDQNALKRKVNNLFRSIQQGDLASFRQIYESEGFSHDIRDQYNWTPLMSATAAGRADIVKYLLNKGASVYSPVDGAGMSAWDIAVKFDNTVIIDLFFQLRVKKEKISPKELNEEENNKELCSVCDVEYRIDDRDKHISSTSHLFQEYKDRSLPSYYHLSSDNIGYRILKDTGWTEEKGLGPKGKGAKNPVSTVLKRDRAGLGAKSDNRKRVTHFRANDSSAVKQPVKKVERVQKKFYKKENEAKRKKSQRWEMHLREYMNRE